MRINSQLSRHEKCIKLLDCIKTLQERIHTIESNLRILDAGKGDDWFRMLNKPDKLKRELHDYRYMKIRLVTCYANQLIAISEVLKKESA